MGAVRPYPHYEINVKDNSIATVSYEEILPVHRALWPMKTQKGKVGEPVWCGTYTAARNEFGEQTFKPASKYFSRQAAFLLDTLTFDGCFIYRILDETATRSVAILEAWVEEAQVEQFKYDDEGNFFYDESGNKIPYNLTGAIYKRYYFTDDEHKELNGGEYVAEYETSEGKKPRVVFYKKYTSNVYDASGTILHKKGDYVLDENKNKIEESVHVPGVSQTDETGELIKDENGAKIIIDYTKTLESGLRIIYRMRNAMTKDEITRFGSVDEGGLEYLTKHTVKETEGTGESAVTHTYTVYPILALTASNKGEYGNDLAFSLNYRSKENNQGDANYFKSIFYSFDPTEREYGTTTVNPHYDKYGRQYVTFAANPDAIDKDTGLIYSMENICNRSYEADGYVLPYAIYTFENSFKEIGNKVLVKELALNADGTQKRSAVDVLPEMLYNISQEYADGIIVREGDGVTTAYKYTFNQGTIPPLETYGPNVVTAKEGFLINVISAVSLNKTMFKHVIIDTDAKDTTYSSVKCVTIIPTSDNNLFLSGGCDGMTEGEDGKLHEIGSIPDSTVLTGIQNLCHVKSFLQIVDKAHYPITHMYDCGYDMKTKYAMLDFLDVRDDIGVSMSTQVLFDNGDGRAIVANDQAADEANGEALRAYALLMRESVLMGTDCCRASIYCHCGVLAAGNYIELMPFTYWDAHQHAMYGRTQYMSVTEPRGLPLAYNDLFRIKTINWTNYSPESQSRVWDTGLNYCQYADMTRIHYPALRTVYRAESSVLVDQWFVDAIIYSKHVIRKAWAKFSGRNDSTAVLQGAIKKYLDTELTNLYAGKYSFEVTVYQTEEELAQGYVQHVKLKLTAPAQFRVLVVDIEVNREGFSPEE